MDTKTRRATRAAVALAACLVCITAQSLVWDSSSARAAGATPYLTTRATTDRVDDAPGPQIHLIYAVPSGSRDRRLDVNGDIAESFEVAERWFATQTDGHRLKLDTFHGRPDITFVRLPESDRQIASHGVFSRDQIEALTRALGFHSPQKIYEVFYDGASAICGSAPWPPSLLGDAPVIYLTGRPSGYPPCSANPTAKVGQHWGYLEMDEVHEIMHTLGFAPACSPHSTGDGHVNDSPTDLMYAGGQPWDTAHMVLDAGHDDYWGMRIPGCLNLADSAFLTNGGTQMPAGFGMTPLTLPKVCIVPNLRGMTLRRATAALRRAACAAGTSQRYGRGARVTAQSAATGSVHAAGFPVSIRLGRRGA